MPPEGAAAEAIEQQLARILDSQTFKSAERSKALLRFIVQEALADRTSRLKDYTLGVEVLDRGEQFDPRTDPIARVEVSRLRSRLDLYYATEGASDPIRILVPKGGYIPEFGTGAAASPGPEAPPPPESAVVHPSGRWARIWLVAAAAIAATVATNRSDRNVAPRVDDVTGTRDATRALDATDDGSNLPRHFARRPPDRVRGQRQRYAVVVDAYAGCDTGTAASGYLARSAALLVARRSRGRLLC